MKKKLLYFGIIFILFSNYIEKQIFKIKNTYYISQCDQPDSTHLKKETNDEIIQKKRIAGEVLENQYHRMVINKGFSHGVKLNQIVVGEKGFVGIITRVESNISEVKTFWNANNHLIAVNGDNAYGYLQSNGYYLSIKSNNQSNQFNNGDNVYLYFKDGLILFGVFNAKKYKRYVTPMENIMKIEKVYIIL